MAKYRKKPVVIEAIKIKDIIFNLDDGKFKPKWLNEAFENKLITLGYDCLVIETLEGKMTAGINDMLIKGINGELYPCKIDIFEKTYEPYEEESLPKISLKKSGW